MTQPKFFDESKWNAPISPRDPNVLPKDKKRLSKQCHKILVRLQEGPAKNCELARIALKYTSRISDLREAGYEIICSRDPGDESGVTTYRLK